MIVIIIALAIIIGVVTVIVDFVRNDVKHGRR